MPTPTYTPLATVTLGASASSVTFSSIPATYRDLIIVATPISTSGVSETALRFNTDSGNNYNRVLMFGTGSTTGSFANTGVSYIGFVDAFTSVGNIGIAQVMDYSATDKHKTVIARKNEPTDALAAIAGRWANTAAITTVSLTALGGGNQFATGSTFSLYGVIA
jgi:hypothetical protein